ncbi:MAG: beta-lactamase family protein [Saprospiraceae bacterium]|nr:beta-lactamase family protein [Saprospiraceae bacterium]
MLLFTFASCEPIRSNNLSQYLDQQAIEAPGDTFAILFEQYVSQKMHACDCPGAAVTIISDSLVRSIKGYGVRSTLSCDTVDVHTLFRLASVSKSFGAVLTDIEVRKGLLSFADPVHRYLPEFELSDSAYTGKVTINNLLSQSAGFPYHSYTNLVEKGYSLSAILPLFKNIRNLAPPGEMYAYQNASYALIEPILENATQRSITDLYAQEIKANLCMPDLCFSYEAMCKAPNIALPHRLDYNQQVHYPIEVSQKYYNTISAGGINASITDMSLWLKLLIGDYPAILPRSAIDSLFQPQIKTTEDRRYYNFWPGVKDTYYARGMRVLDYGDHYKYYHGGFANEYRAEIAIDPRLHIGIAALFNSTCSLADDIVPTFFTMFEEWMGGCR